MYRKANRNWLLNGKDPVGQVGDVRVSKRGSNKGHGHGHGRGHWHGQRWKRGNRRGGVWYNFAMLTKFFRSNPHFMPMVYFYTP